MSYKRLQNTLAANIKTLSSSIDFYVRKYKCKSAFELFNMDFDGDVNEKIRIMGYVHRRDAFIYIANIIGQSQLSIREEQSESVSGVIPTTRKWEIIGNAFVRKAEDLLTEVSVEDSTVFIGLDESDPKHVAAMIQDGAYEEAFPLYAALWYNKNVEIIGLSKNTESEGDTRPCDV